MPMYVTPEVIAKAREIDAFSYLQAYDPGELVKCGHNEYCTRTHDSLKLSRGKWFWWSQGFGGVSALDYLVKVEGVDFVKAVKQLCGQVSITAPVSSSGAKAEPRGLRLPPYNYECKTVREYLRRRCVDDEVITFFIERKMIGEDNENRYALFFGNDEKGRHRQCSTRATDGSINKRDVSGSDRKYSFCLASDYKSETLRVFESAIDMMSFATLMKGAGNEWKHENLLSLSGVYMPARNLTDSKVPVALQRFLDEHSHIRRILLHLDSDRAGSMGAQGLIAVLGDKYDMKYLPPSMGKDWNDYLCLKEKDKELQKNRSERA